MSVFLLVSRSLRTGEPLQETLPKSLFDQAFYHHRRTHQHRENEHDTTTNQHWDQLQSVEFMAFAAGTTALYKILMVRGLFKCPSDLIMNELLSRLTACML